MFIVKLVKNLSVYDMGIEETNIVICKSIQTAIDQASKLIDRELDWLHENDEELFESAYICTEDEFARWSNSINGTFKFYADKYEDRMVEIEEVNFVE